MEDSTCKTLAALRPYRSKRKSKANCFIEKERYDVPQGKWNTIEKALLADSVSRRITHLGWFFPKEDLCPVHFYQSIIIHIEASNLRYTQLISEKSASSLASALGKLFQQEVLNRLQLSTAEVLVRRSPVQRCSIIKYREELTLQRDARQRAAQQKAAEQAALDEKERGLTAEAIGDLNDLNKLTNNKLILSPIRGGAIKILNQFVVELFCPKLIVHASSCKEVSEFAAEALDKSWHDVFSQHWQPDEELQEEPEEEPREAKRPMPQQSLFVVTDPCMIYLDDVPYPCVLCRKHGTDRCVACKESCLETYSPIPVCVLDAQCQFKERYDGEVKGQEAWMKLLNRTQLLVFKGQYTLTSPVWPQKIQETKEKEAKELDAKRLCERAIKSVPKSERKFVKRSNRFSHGSNFARRVFDSNQNEFTENKDLPAEKNTTLFLILRHLIRAFAVNQPVAHPYTQLEIRNISECYKKVEKPVVEGKKPQSVKIWMWFIHVYGQGWNQCARGLEHSIYFRINNAGQLYQCCLSNEELKNKVPCRNQPSLSTERTHHTLDKDLLLVMKGQKRKEKVNILQKLARSYMIVDYAAQKMTQIVLANNRVSHDVTGNFMAAMCGNPRKRKLTPLEEKNRQILLAKRLKMEAAIQLSIKDRTARAEARQQQQQQRQQER